MDKKILEYSFLHLPGIGRIKELNLWKLGILNWDDYDFYYNKQLDLFNNKLTNTQEIIDRSREALVRGDTNFFARLLPHNEHYRIALSYPNETMFLDIETTGLSKYYDKITVIGWSIGDEYNFYLQNSSLKKFIADLQRAKAIVTFNGIIFDLPFILHQFNDLSFPEAHIDLRFFSRLDNFSGGQKIVEEEMGFERPKELKELKGETAPILWYKYRFGDMSALEKLLLYNFLDIVGMKFIFDKIARQLIIRNQYPTGFEKLSKFYTNSFFSDNNLKSKVLGKNDLPKFKGQPGPKILLENLTQHYIEKKLKIVGIDLSGSESKASGFCLLEHDYALTEPVYTDEELIRKIKSFSPDIISIDSPLSMPIGRITVFDDDPGREEYGIMRSCEKILKKRGINVYPSLIPSMQKLTFRGMKLAKLLRETGFPVIESYPGAAQDIIDIPRKRASLDYLKKGLETFGIKGNYLKTEVSHDELDAITSALVGHFFWSGKYEALGNEEEEYLIIPNLEINNIGWLNRRVLGLSGPISSGKTTAGEYLKSKNFVYFRYSLVLKKILEGRNQPVNRDTLQEIGEQMSFGQRDFSKLLYKELINEENIVIDGLRFPEDYSFWVEKFGPAFLHINIDSAYETRKNRYIVSENKNEEDFIRISEHHVERSVLFLNKLAHLIIKNNSSKEDFFINLEQSLFKITREN